MLKILNLVLEWNKRLKNKSNTHKISLIHKCHWQREIFWHIFSSTFLGTCEMPERCANIPRYI